MKSTLPSTEKYVISPPPNCPITPPNTYLHLKQALYGLKRAPRHWYDKLVTIMTKLGLKKCPHSPCLFAGRILQNKPPIYVGIYVDDYIYFSTSDEVEHAFENKMASLLQNDISFIRQFFCYLYI